MIGPGTNQWSTDGNFQWTTDGFTGSSTDGYEPTSLAVAVSAFAAVGVNVGTLTYAYDPLVPVGYVITGYVPLLANAPPGSYVPLTISDGPAPIPATYTVPNLVGMFYSDAQQAILSAGFFIAPPQFVVSNTVKPQYVIAQMVAGQPVAAGTQFHAQTQVTIVVSGFPVVNTSGQIIGVP